MAYNAYVVKVKDIRKHSNADRLQVVTFFGNDVVVGLDTKEGDMGIYFPTDGKLGKEFAEKNNLVRMKDENGNQVGGYLDPEKRHVTSIKLRGEKSDGLYVPISSLSSFTNISKLKEGDTIAIINGITICEKYVPIKKNNNSTSTPKNKQVKKPKESFPFFEEHIDTKQFAYNLNSFKEGDICTISLKIHGTSQRTAYTIKEATPTFIQRLLRIKPKNVWEYVSGTRRVTLDNFKGGYYGGNEFREKWHNFFKGKLQKGEEVFYELVGFVSEDKLIMPECDNKKTKDKEFIKQYGDKTRFTYGCENGQNDIYVYRMTMTNEDGHVVEYPSELVKIRCEQMGVKHAPILEQFICTTKEDLLERVNSHTDGVDPIGKTHLREGVIVRIENREKFTALKNKSFNFKVLEGIIKESDVLDIEEAESLNQLQVQ